MSGKGVCGASLDTLSQMEIIVFAVVAGLIIALHTLLAKRAKTGARIAIPIPISFLQVSDYGYRLLYCLAFTGSTSGIYNLVVHGTLIVDSDVSRLARVFLEIVSFIVVGLVYYPIFISIATASSVIGSAIGLAYTTSFLVCKIDYLATCDAVLSKRATELVGNLPGILALFALVVYFGYKLIVQIGRGFSSGRWVWISYLENTVTGEAGKIWQHVHVRRIFHPFSPPEQGFTRRQKLVRKIYKQENCFQYSLRIIIPLCVGLNALYYLGMVGTIAFVLYEENFLPTFNANARYLFNWIAVSAYCALIMAIVSSLVQLYNIARLFRKDMNKMYHGAHPSQENRVLDADIRFKPLVKNHSTLYIGHQAAVIVLGCVYQLVLFWIVFMALSFFIFYGQINGSSAAATLFFQLATPLIFVVVVYIIEHIIVYFVFLVDRGKFSLVTNNRRLFNFTYFIFFWNLLIGFFFSLLRVIISFFVSSIMVSSFSTPVVAPDFIILDIPHRIYKNVLRQEDKLTNPCLVMFARILLLS